jgi:hypothetical protein
MKEGRPFGFGNQVLISSHRKLLRLNAVAFAPRSLACCVV